MNKTEMEVREEVELSEKLFQFVIGSELNILDWGNINDYFMFKTIDLLEEKNKVKIELYVRLFEGYANISDNIDKFYEGFFFALCNLLSVKFEVKRLSLEKIKREEWEQSFRETLERLNLQEYSKVL
tara:strand:+ start:597 stop:977 length:381 start_codon:yes stop_codon:yes gene_type:complete